MPSLKSRPSDLVDRSYEISSLASARSVWLILNPMVLVSTDSLRTTFSLPRAQGAVRSRGACGSHAEWGDQAVRGRRRDAGSQKFWSYRAGGSIALRGGA